MKEEKKGRMRKEEENMKRRGKRMSVRREVWKGNDGEGK